MFSFCHNYFDLIKSNSQSLGLDSSPKRIREVADASLKHLQTDVIDLFTSIVLASITMEDIARNVKDLIKDCKIKSGFKKQVYNHFGGGNPKMKL